MEPETVLNLFDSNWFYLKIFEKESKSSTPEQNPNPQIQENPSEPNISSQLSILSRSKSDSLSYLSASPDSVLKPHLQTVLTDREASLEIPKPPQPQKPIENLQKMKNKFSKSLSELEFEEVKGFMDLGFVFSEEDKDSSLVEIIPGLQRLGHETGNYNDHRRKNEERRPYLSEVWQVSEEKRPLMEWRVPAITNEMDMKDSLKWWAHTVASAAR